MIAEINKLFTLEDHRLIAQMMKIKEEYEALGFKEWSEIFTELFPEYNDRKEFAKAQRVWYLRRADRVITEHFELMLEKLKGE